MKKIFNSRPLFLGGVSLIIAIVLTTNYLFSNSLLYKILLSIFIVFNCFLILYISHCIIKKIFKSNQTFITCIFVVILACIGIVGTFFNMPKSNYLGENEAVLVGTIASCKTINNTTILNLDDLKINDTKLDNQLNLAVFTYEIGEDGLKVGNIIRATVNVVAINKDMKNIKSFASGVYYEANCSVDSIEILGSEKSFKNTVKQKIQFQLNEFLNDTNASLSYSILFGETENMDTETLDVFTFSGLAHVLSVSGLHVVFLVGMLAFLLRICKANKNITNFVILLMLIFYAYLCNFSPSVIRAVIMSMVFLLSTSYGKQYDALNSIALALVLSLLFNPLTLFLAGFQLSFVCVLSIIILSKPIYQFLRKLKAPHKLASALSVPLAINIGIVAVSAQHFHQINLISIFSNLVVLPLFSIYFGILYFVAFVGLIIPPINILLLIPDMILHVVKLLANFFASLKFLIYDIFNFNYLIVIFSLFLLHFVGYAIVSKKSKKVVVYLTLLVCVSCAIGLNVPQKFNSYFVTSSYTNSGNYLFFTTADNERYLVLNKVYDSSRVIKELQGENVNKINYLIVNNYTVKDNDIIVELTNRYKINKLYVENANKNLVLDNLKGKVLGNFVDETFNINLVYFQFYYNYDKNIGIEILLDNKSFFVINDNANRNDILNLSYQKEHFNYIYANNMLYNLPELGVRADVYMLNKTARFEGDIVYLFLK